MDRDFDREMQKINNFKPISDVVLSKNEMKKYLEFLKEGELVSVSIIQKQFLIGYSRAAKIIGKLYSEGYLEQDLTSKKIM